MLNAQLCFQGWRSVPIVVSLAEPHQRGGVPARSQPGRDRVLPGLQLLCDIVCLVGNVGAKIVPSGRQNLVADAGAVYLKPISSQCGYIKARRGHRLVDPEAVT